MTTRFRDLAVGVALFSALSGCGPELPAVERVILITIDTLRADHLGSYGYPRRVAPFLDELAGDSVLFERAISSSSHTGPSHASIMTALHPKQHGVMTNLGRLPDEVTTLAGALGSAGFDTAGFTAVRFLVGVQSGFEHFETNDSPPARREWAPADVVVDKALGWLERRAPTDRYFLWLHLYDPHQWTKLARPKPEEQEVGGLSSLSDEEFLDFLAESHGMHPRWRPPQGQLGAIDRYDALILRADRELRRFYEALADRGDLERSLLIVTADHGEGLGSHRTSGHGKHLYQEQVRVPLLVRVDGAGLAGERRTELVSHVDLLPTVANLVGLENVAEGAVLSGRSIVPILAGAPEGPARLAFSQRRPASPRRLSDGWAPGDVISLQSHALKYIHRTEGADELYDLAGDPLELHNLIASPPHGARDLRSELLRMNAEMVSQAAESLLLDESHLDDLKALGYLQ